MNPDNDAGQGRAGVSRRGFLDAGTVAAAAVADAAPAVAAEDDGFVAVRVTVGVDPRGTLLDRLHEKLEPTGTKKGCDRGQCGACTVHVDGRCMLSCLTPSVTTDGRGITTVEGLADAEQLPPMRQVFIEHDGFQCGFCTPGQIMSTVAMVDEGPASADAEIRERMSGNICRRSAYPFIVDAVRDGREAMR